jgi:hypothetical protein
VGLVVVLKKIVPPFAIKHNVNNAIPSSHLSENQRNDNNETNNLNSIANNKIMRRKYKSQQLLLMTIILSIFSFVTHVIVAFVQVF